ncbi:opioid growth factor receptor-like [Salminus brasiliensis]|uniref:opioid growth factor receptor-like n=1 Tax=Salminus brasiliensis TaxID=930266 RepID=UPI003B82E7F6
MGVPMSTQRSFISTVWTSCSWLWRFFLNVVSRALIMFRYSVKGSGHSEREDREKDYFDTEYDSTWEDEEDDDDDDAGTDETKGVSIKWRVGAHRNTYAAEDMQNFRHMLKKVKKTLNAETVNINEFDDHEIPNLLFYQNKRPSQPDGVFIDEFHEDWFGEYDKLEWVHSYIQWLFPIQEKGLNYDSYKLTQEEIKLFRQDEAVKKRLVKSYKLMLDFYGIELLDERTGSVQCAKKWRERFENLNRNSHNNLRITRILKCLGILGLKHYQAPLVRFFLKQTLVKGELPRVKQSVLDYFMFTVVKKSERKKLIRFAFQNFKPLEEFVWCPKKVQRRFLRENKPQTTGHSDSACSKPESDAQAKGTQPENEGTSDVSTSPGVQDNGGVGEEGGEKDPPEEMEVTPAEAISSRNTEEVTNEGQELQRPKSPPAVQSTDEKGNVTNQESKEDQCQSNSNVLHNKNDTADPKSPKQDGPDTHQSNTYSAVQHAAENTDDMTKNEENGH